MARGEKSAFARVTWKMDSLIQVALHVPGTTAVQAARARGPLQAPGKRAPGICARARCRRVGLRDRPYALAAGARRAARCATRWRCAPRAAPEKRHHAQ